jgi:hypothetical protein
MGRLCREAEIRIVRFVTVGGPPQNYGSSQARAAATLKISARLISFDVGADDPGSLRSGKRDCTLPLLRAAAVEP